MSEVVRQAHIALSGVREALQEVDVFHFCRRSAFRPLAGASAYLMNWESIEQ